MADDLFNQIQHNAPVAGGGVLGALLTWILGKFQFATKADLANHRADVAEKYMSKAGMKPMQDELGYIRKRVDQIADKL